MYFLLEDFARVVIALFKVVKDACAEDSGSDGESF